MNLLRLSAVSIAMVGLPLSFSAVIADESEEISSAQAAIGSELSHWADFADDDSSLLTQARAVFADLRAKRGLPPEAPTVAKNVQIVAMNDEPRALRTGNGSEGCNFMEIPGSRIREWRCYYPNEGEKILNAYQFREEIRQNIRQGSVQDMNRTSTQIFIQETMQNPSMFQRQR